MSGHDSGAGAPLQLDIGAGDPTNVFLGTGAGDPIDLSMETAGLGVPPIQVGEEGGYTIRLVFTTPLDDPPYRVNFVDSLGQRHPLTQAGALSGVLGDGRDIYPIHADFALECGTPPLKASTTAGDYSIEVVSAGGVAIMITNAIESLPLQVCLEMESLVSRLDPRVYYTLWEVVPDWDISWESS